MQKMLNWSRSVAGSSDLQLGRFITKTLLVMKLTTFFVLAACLQVSAKGFSQNITYSGSNVPLPTVFNVIKQQTGYHVVYNPDWLEKAKLVSVSAKSVPLKEFLQQALKDQPFDFSIENTTIILSRKPTNNTQSTSPAIDKFDQQPPPPFQVRGIVRDVDGNMLAGASIVNENTKLTVTTDANGIFSITASEGDVLAISFVGFEKIKIKTNSATTAVVVSSDRQRDLSGTDKSKALSFFTDRFIITLSAVETTLGEVIVNKGYYNEKQRYTLGNSVHIDAKAFEQSPVQNPLLAIQGRATGIEITQLTGMSGGGIKLQIQGINSFGSLPGRIPQTSNDPLIVVDGVPYPAQNIGIDPSNTLEEIVQGGSPLNYINPNDIESIDILKDADATSIFGSRAANGAILITTKKGKVGKTKVTINLQQGWSKVGHFVNMMNTRQYLDMRYEAYRNDGIAIANLVPNSSNYDIKLWDTTRYTNWQKTLIGGTARYSNFQAGLSGGNVNAQYVVGATFNRRTTVFPGEFDNKLGNVHFNMNVASSNQRLKLQLTGSYGYDDNHLPGNDLTDKAVLLEPVAPMLKNSDGTLNWAPNAAGTSTWVNPLSASVGTDFNNTTKCLVANANVSYRVFDGLEIQSNFGYSSLRSELYIANRLEIYKPESRALRVRTARFGNRDMNSWIIEPQIKYSGSLGKGTIQALVATNIQKTGYSYLSFDASGFATDLLMKTLRAATSTSIRQSVSGTTRFNAVFGRLGYNWNEKYLINFTARRDGSNKFGPKARFHNFYSVAGGWIFSDEKGISNLLPMLSFGKLRISYGITGSDGIPDFAYLSLYNINNPSILYQNSIGLFASNIPNPNLQWEETHKWQGGLDIGFIKDRIQLGITYARNRSSNQLTGIAIPSVAGFQYINKNLTGIVVENTSIEVTLNTINLRTNDFLWSTSFNITWPRNKLISFPDSSGYKDIGKPLGYFAVAAYGGINPANGGYLVLDKKGNPFSGPPTYEDQTIILSNLAPYYGGLINSIQFKQFQLDFMFQFVRKRGTRDMYYSNGARTPGGFSGGSTANQPVSVLDHWRKPGDEAPVGRFTTGFLNNSYMVSDGFYSYEASFIRLKNVSFSCQLPSSWLKKLRLQSARIYAHAQNLLTISKYRGLDPETMSLGLPPLRTITVGVQTDF